MYKDNNKYLKKLRQNKTKSESIVEEWFRANKIRAIFQKGFFKPFHRICDFYIPSGGTIVEIDGGYHKDTISKDNLKDDLWAVYRGMGTIRITNEQVLSGEYKKILGRHFL